MESENQQGGGGGVPTDSQTALMESERAAFAAIVRKRIKLLREASGLPQSSIAAALGEQLNTYKRWEMDTGGNMPPHHYMKFCTIMDARIEAFLERPPVLDPDIEFGREELFRMRPRLREG